MSYLKENRSEMHGCAIEKFAHRGRKHENSLLDRVNHRENDDEDCVGNKLLRDKKTMTKVKKGVLACIFSLIIYGGITWAEKLFVNQRNTNAVNVSATKLTKPTEQLAKIEQEQTQGIDFPKAMNIEVDCRSMYELAKRCLIQGKLDEKRFHYICTGYRFMQAMDNKAASVSPEGETHDKI
jgi:hypothetical protein